MRRETSSTVDNIVDLGFLIIFLLGFVLINYFVGQHIEKSNENIISTDLVRDRDNLNIYTRQYF